MARKPTISSPIMSKSLSIAACSTCNNKPALTVAGSHTAGPSGVSIGTFCSTAACSYAALRRSRICLASAMSSTKRSALKLTLVKVVNKPYRIKTSASLSVWPNSRANFAYCAMPLTL